MQDSTGYAVSLFTILGESYEINQQDLLHLKHAALVQLKNIVSDRWITKNSRNHQCLRQLDQSDKAYLMEHVLTAITIFVENKKFLDLLLKTLNKIAYHEFPGSWTNLPQKMLDMINSGDISKMKGAMHALCEITQVCQYNYTVNLQVIANTPNQALNSVIIFFEPAVRGICSSLAATYAAQERRDFQDQTHLNAAEFLLLGFNFLRHSSKVSLPDYFLQNEEYLTIWLNIIAAVINKPLYEKENIDFSEEMAANDSWWNIKCSVSKIIWNMLMKLTRSKDSKFQINVAQKYLTNYFNNFGFKYMQELKRSKQYFMPSKYVKFMLYYLNLMIKQECIRKVGFAEGINNPIQTNWFRFITEDIFYYLKLDKKDLAYFNNEPIDYLRSMDIDADPENESQYGMVRRCASKLVFDCCKIGNYVTKSELTSGSNQKLDRKLYLIQKEINHNWLNQILIKIIDNLNNSKNDMQLKESMLYLLHTLNYRITEDGKVLQHMEKVFMDHAFAELTNTQVPLMQHTSMTLYSVYYKMSYKQMQHQNAIISAILQNLNSNHAAVSVQAGITLRYYIRKPSFKSYIVNSNIVEIVRKILFLLEKYEHDHLVNTIQVFVDEYTEHVTPVAIDLMRNLTHKFHSYYSAKIEDNDPNQKESQELYTNCINTLYNIITAIKGNTAMMAEAYPMVESVLDKVFVYIDAEPECLSNAADLLHLIIMNVPVFNDKLYQYFWWYEYAIKGHTLNGVHQGQFDFFDMNTFLGNYYDFALKDEHFLERRSPHSNLTPFEFGVLLMMDVTKHCISNHDDTNPDVLLLVKAVMRMVDCMRTKLETPHYSAIVRFYLEVLQTDNKFPTLKMFFTQLQCLCIYCNPLAYFSCNCGEEKALATIVSLVQSGWVKKGGEISRTLYAIGSIFKCYAANLQLPPYVTNMLQTLYNCSLTLLQDRIRLVEEDQMDKDDDASDEGSTGQRRSNCADDAPEEKQNQHMVDEYMEEMSDSSDDSYEDYDKFDIEDETATDVHDQTTDVHYLKQSLVDIAKNNTQLWANLNSQNVDVQGQMTFAFDKFDNILKKYYDETNNNSNSNTNQYSNSNGIGANYVNNDNNNFVVNNQVLYNC